VSMVSQKRLLLIVPILAVAGACSPQKQVSKSTAPPPVHFQLLAFSPAANGQWQARLDQGMVTLLNPDKADRPTAWDGPLRIQLSAAAACAAELSLVTRVYGASGVEYLVALSYSGSMRYIHFVDLKSCREKWPVQSVYSERIDVAGDTLSVLPACECPGGSAPCVCSAAQIYRLSAALPPEPLPATALAVTRKMLGVEFTGERKVLRPHTPTAELLKE
jgi:hypothetical protein